MRRIIVLVSCISFIAAACQSETTPDSPAETKSAQVALTSIVISTASPAPTVGGIAAASPTATAPPTQTPTLVPSPTPQTPPMPIPTPMTPLVDYYIIQSGDTLGGISFAYDISIEDLLVLNSFESEDVIINVGQTLRVPLNVSRTGPVDILLPDSEVVYSPTYIDFDIQAFLDAQGGFFAAYAERVDGKDLPAAKIVEKVARSYSVGPRVLLALAEYYGGWITYPEPTAYQLGAANPYSDRLYLQLSWLANRINEGYYGYKQSGSIAISFKDRSRAIVPPGLNAGTVGIQNALAANSNWEMWQTEVSADGFIETYRSLFGDPFTRAVEPLVPIDLTQPPLNLPWEAGQTFYYTGGPHPAYNDGSGWAAVDFGPPDVLGNCFYSHESIVAAANGTLDIENKGHFYLDLDGDGNLQTGWVLLYLHAALEDGLETGQIVTADTPLGFASCEGGISNSSHLHFARRYNGEWMAAAGPVPMVLSGWQVQAGAGQYDGAMIRGEESKASCECWDEEKNALLRNAINNE